jgi:integrase
MSLSPLVISAIVPHEELSEMAKKRYQQPSVLKTTGKRPMWFFRARVDAITTKDGQRGLSRPQERFYTGYADEMTKQEAKRYRDEILSDLINKPQVLITSQVQFGEVLKVYKRDHLATLRDTTRNVQEAAIRKHFEEPLGHLRMCDLADALTIQRWLSGMEVAYRTKQGYLALLKIIWAKAQQWGYTQQVFPLGKFSLGVKRSVKGHELPTMDQLRRLLAALPDPFRAMAEIALYTGLRISEIRGLTWSDVGQGTLTVSRRVSQMNGEDVTKSSRERFFDLRPIAATLARIPKVDEWIFYHPGAGYWVCGKKMRAAARAAGIKTARFGWHHLRAIFNTLARSSGADAVDRQALMGHADERMNAVYVMQADEDVRRRGDLMLAVQSAILGETKGIQ